MKIAIFIALSMPLLAMETIICKQTQSGLNCSKYNGGDYTVYNYPKSYESDHKNINFHEGDGFEVMSIESESDDARIGEVEESNTDTIGIDESFAAWAAGFNFALEKKD